MYKTITILIISLCIPAAFSQHITWQSCYGSSLGEHPYGLLKTKSGYIISTTIHDNELQIPGYHGENDACLIGLDTSGNFLWHRCYGGSKDDTFNKTIQNPDNTYHVLGYSKSDDGDLNTPIQGLYDSWLVKLDRSFKIIWQRTFGSPSTEQFRDALLTTDGGLLVLSRVSIAGYNVSVVYGPSDLWVCKFSPDGEMEWEKTIGNYYNDNALSIRKTNRKDMDTYYIIGSSEYVGGMVECRKSSGYDQDVIIYEIDRAGNLLRQFCYGGSNDDLGKDVLPLRDGFIFTASTKSNDMDVSGNHGEHDIWVVRCDTSGAILWQKCFGGSDYEYPVFIDTAQNGSYVVIGNTFSIDGDVIGQHSLTGGDDVWVFSIDSVGNIMSSQCFGSTAYEYSLHNTIARNGNYDYTISIGAQSNSGDVTCLPYPGAVDDIWTFNVRICDFMIPTIPTKPSGPDSLCSNATPVSVFTTQTANLAWAYQWQIAPPEAGSISGSSIQAEVQWNPAYDGQANIKVRSSNDCGYSAYSDSTMVIVRNCSSIEEILAKGGFVKVYPNPASGTVNFELSSVWQQYFGHTPPVLQLHDVSGQKLMERNFIENSLRINLSHLKPGMYFWTLSNTAQSLHGKLVVE
jgi:hypothetical protein